MFQTRDRLIILDADGTIIDAFGAIAQAFGHHDMDLGDLERFQKRHNIFKYLGGVKEFPANLTKQIGKRQRNQLLDTLTDVYRTEAVLFPGIPKLIGELVSTPGLRVGMMTRNITHEPAVTLARLFDRHGLDLGAFDFVECLPLSDEKQPHFKALRARLGVNPARAFACGDEHRDYQAAISAGMHPFMVSYGFESFERLTGKFGIPEELIVGTPMLLAQRIRHSLDLTE